MLEASHFLPQSWTSSQLAHSNRRQQQHPCRQPPNLLVLPEYYDNYSQTNNTTPSHHTGDQQTATYPVQPRPQGPPWTRNPR